MDLGNLKQILGIYTPPEESEKVKIIVDKTYFKVFTEEEQEDQGSGANGMTPQYMQELFNSLNEMAEGLGAIADQMGEAQGGGMGDPTQQGDGPVEEGDHKDNTPTSEGNSMEQRDASTYTVERKERFN